MNQQIYFDHAATTKVRAEVVEAMTDYFSQMYGNPSSIYGIARISKKALESARDTVARALGCDSAEIFFTGSGTEADNWALKGVAEAYQHKGKHVITSAIEHHAVLHTCQYLEKHGFEVTYLPVDAFGVVRLEDVQDAVRSDTILISIMFANNEIGSLQPIEEIGRFAKERGILFHTDAVQAVGHVPLDLSKLAVDLLSVSAHKMYGPKGVGALYIRKGVKIFPLLHGGAQERKKRSGTENIPGIVGFAKAVELALMELAQETQKLTAMRERLIDGILETTPYCQLNGHRTNRLPGNINISFEFIEGESLLLLLDMEGVYASSGSACTSGSLDPSHVLLALGLPHEKSRGSLRITLGRENTIEEVERFIQILPPIVQRLRDMSPLYEDFLKRNGEAEG